MAKTITVVIKDSERQYEGLRYSLGLMFEDHKVCMVVLDHEADSSEEYAENAQFMDELDGNRLSNVDANVSRHGFRPTSSGDLAMRMADSDLVIPF